MGNKDYILKKIISLIKEKYPNSNVYLYGSRARGNFTSESDWDILVLLPDDQITNEIEESIIESLYDLELETGEVISPLIYSQKEWDNKHSVTPFYNNVMREGMLL